MGWLRRVLGDELDNVGGGTKLVVGGVLQDEQFLGRGEYVAEATASRGEVDGSGNSRQ